MDNKPMAQIPYIIHEAEMQRLRDAMRRLLIALIIMAALLVAMWILK